MKRTLALLYGLAAYAGFVGVFLYAIGFVTNFLVPKSVDGGAAGPTGTALLVDAALLGLFAVQHSVMARPWFKRWWTRFVPATIERSTFVLAADLALIALYAFWRPLPAVIWQVQSPAAVAAIWTVAGVGWAIVFLSTFMIGHWELFGLKQVWLNLRQRSMPRDDFRTPALYRLVRHPIMVGFIIAFWAAPTMTAGHLLFAAATTGYILIAVQLEERDLLAKHGERYQRYREQVRAFVPVPRTKRAEAEPA
jgi:protein-S-isoprenylcysteine O-methyltransferase Ste14